MPGSWWWAAGPTGLFELSMASTASRSPAGSWKLRPGSTARQWPWLPFAWLAARSVGVDILSVGTGNPGAANVFRLVDKRLGILVFLADVAKGAVPVVVALLIGVPEELVFLAGMAAIIGHWRPVVPRLGGGAGLASATGAAVAVAPLAGLVMLAFGFIALAIFKSSGHAAAVGILALAISGYAVFQDWELTSGTLALAALIMGRHIAVEIKARRLGKSSFT